MEERYIRADRVVGGLESIEATPPVITSRCENMCPAKSTSSTAQAEKRDADTQSKETSPDLTSESPRRSESKDRKENSEDGLRPPVIESRASSIEPYSDGSDYEVEDNSSDADAAETDDDDQPEHEYIVMLQDDTTRELFDAIIQDAKNQGMIIKSKTFSTLSKFQIKSFTVKATEEKLQGLKSLQSGHIRFYGVFIPTTNMCSLGLIGLDKERNQPVRIQATRKKTHQTNNVPETVEQENSETQGASTSMDVASASKTS